jgi:multidrug efflux system membrane fusion protein
MRDAKRVGSTAVALISALIAGSSYAAEFTVRARPVEDRKAVIGTVEPVHQIVARARIGGTITELKIKEGAEVAAGAEVASVADQKLFIQMQALDQRINSQQAQRDKAKSDFNRAKELFSRGVTTKAALDAARAGFDVSERNLAALRSDRGVIEQQAAEGSVRAPGAGRVLSIPVSVGRVVMAGETIAVMAENRYILRLQLPERHAKFMRAGDQVFIGARGLDSSGGDARKEGRVRIVYPEIQGGRVVADVDVPGLGDYFVGERTRVYVTTGRRDAIILPRDATYHRAGVDYVKLQDGSEIVVQLGERAPDSVEILSGLQDGDIVVTP